MISGTEARLSKITECGKELLFTYDKRICLDSVDRIATATLLHNCFRAQTFVCTYILLARLEVMSSFLCSESEQYFLYAIEDQS